jgi:hypothetical protein
VDPVSVAVIGWLTNQAATTGQHALVRALIGDKRQNALRRVVRDAITSAVEVVVTARDRESVRNALLREPSGPSALQVTDVSDLRNAVMRGLAPRLTVLAEQGYEIDTDRLGDLLVMQIERGIRADIMRDGPLRPVAEWLHFEGIAVTGDAMVAQLAELNRRNVTLRGLRTAILDHSRLFDQIGIGHPDRGEHGTSAYRVGFTGREWLLSQVDEFINSHRRGYVLVEGEAGVGKSAFALWLATTRGYACHFTRLPGGQDTSNAIRNLGAQLITRLGLEEFAPSGALPSAAGQPHWLQKVITAAAACQQTEQPGIPLVLVVDGLDEANPASGPPLGLPPTLPDGVFVVATLRAGFPLRWLLEEHTTCTLSPSGVANLDDMRRYLEAACGEPEIAAALDADGVAVEWFTTTLLERCAGVWIYLHYVLQEVRDRRRSPARLAQLPRGLWAYYTENLDDLRSDVGRWDNFYLPLLATLAVTQETVSPATLAALADLPTRSNDVRRFVAGAWRPFCTHFADNHYGLYHRSLRDYLTGMPGLGSGDSPEFTSVDRLELEEAARQAHQRIADRYLSAWGGLDDGLPTLAADLRVAVLDSGYGLRHLPTHLVEAIRTDDVHRLLACEQPSGLGPHASNVWYIAQHSAGNLDVYLAQIASAMGIARFSATSAHSEGESAGAIGLQIRYALIAASIISLAVKLPTELITALLAQRIWQPVQALTYIRNNPDLAARAGAYVSAMRYLPDTDRPDVLAAALEAAQAIGNEGTQADVLAALAPHLTPALLPAALETAQAIRDEGTRARALAALAPHLPDALLPGTLKVAQAIKDNETRADALAALAPYLPEVDRPGILAAALEAAQGIGDEEDRARALAALAPHLPEADRPGILAAALEAAQGTRDEENRARALAALAPHLTPPLLRTALETAQTINSEGSRARALAALAPHLTPPLLRTALETAQTIRDNGDRTGLLAALAPYLPDTLLSVALDAAQAINSEWARARALAALAPHLTPPLLRTALETAQAIRDNGDRTDALAALTPHLPDADRPSILAAALEAAQAIKYEGDRARALAALAPHLPAGDRPGILAAALDATRDIRPDETRARALAALAPHLTPPLLRTALETAQAIKYEGARARALAGLALHLTPALLRTALETAQAISGDAPRALALTAVALALPDTDRPAILAAALKAAQAISHDESRANALAGLAPHLTPALLLTALETAQAISGEAPRALALTAVALSLRSEDVVELAGLSKDIIATELLKGLTRRHALRVLGAAAPLITSLGGDKAIAACGKAVIDVTRWWP